MRHAARWAVAVAFAACTVGLAVTGSARAGDLPRAEVRPDKALVYVLRASSVGFIAPAYFFVDQTFVGVNRGDSYFWVYVEPGRHLFWARMENVDAVEAEVEAGKTYYVRQKTLLGLLNARLSVEFLDPQVGEKMLAEDITHHSEISDEERARGEEHAKRLFGKAQEKAGKKT